jgi:CBS domain-containing protein
MFKGDNNMHAQFKPLSYSDLSNGTQLAQSSNTAGQEDSALVVMTDLNKIKAFTIESIASIDFANSKMIACGVRLLFVMNADDVLVGLITASDLFGETPITHMQKHGGLREDILVQDIMTPRAKLKTLQMADVIKAKVGDIIETMKDFGRQHILVVDKQGDESNERICGLFSTTQISRQLGIEINLSPRASTFAEFKSSMESYS